MEKNTFQFGGFGDISVVFVYGNQWFWSKFCPKIHEKSMKIMKNQWKINEKHDFQHKIDVFRNYSGVLVGHSKGE